MKRDERTYFPYGFREHRQLVVSDLEGFETRYGTGLPVAGQFSGTLDNGGERIALMTSDDISIQDFVYDDEGTWPGRADGIGSSLEIINTASSYDNSENWRSSSEYNGSPGTSGAGLDGRIVINEVLTNTDLPAVDHIELHNPTARSIEVVDWYLSDASSNYRKFRIPSGIIPSGGYMTWDENDFHSTQNLNQLACINHMTIVGRRDNAGELEITHNTKYGQTDTQRPTLFCEPRYD